MSWLSNFTPPGIKNLFKRQDDGADPLWVKCGGCGEMLFGKDLEDALNVCKGCGHQMRMAADQRLKSVFDDGVYRLIEISEPPLDPLTFRDEKKYVDRLKDARRKTGRQDAMQVALGAVEGETVVVAVQDFDFMGGSMGMALGESIIRGAETAVRESAPLIVFTASGGARMQEGILSLMQMPRTTIAVQMMREAGLPYIVVLTHPTTGGVTASYAMLGDVHLAGAGADRLRRTARNRAQTIREKLPEGFQRSEFLKEKGMVDAVVPRAEIRSTLASIIRVLMKKSARGGARNFAPVVDRAAE
ncbi:MAG: acetyl-CoA carboxylase carboxyltransferase subunit beta [Parvularculaceae bacterium]